MTSTEYAQKAIVYARLNCGYASDLPMSGWSLRPATGQLRPASVISRRQLGAV